MKFYVACGIIKYEVLYMSKEKFRALLRSRIFIIFLIVIQVMFLVFLFVGTSETSLITTFGMMLLSMLAVLYIVSKNEKSGYKLTWVITIFAFPLFGGLFYIIFNFQTVRKKARRKIEEIRKRKDKFYYLNGDDSEEAYDKCIPYNSHIKYLQNFAGFPIKKNTESEYFSSGEAMYNKLIQELKSAEKYIFLEYFIVSDGKMWQSILDILVDKAKSGVKVRLIYDDMGCFLQLPKDYPQYLRSLGIECEIFNSFKPIISTVQNNRDHRKITVIDGKCAFSGGINLADEYINQKDKGHGHWKDAAIMLKGKGAWSFTVMFLQMWELCTGYNEDYSLYYPVGYTGDIFSNGYVQPYTDSPMDKENVGEHVYLKIINSAVRYLYISTPYLILDDSIMSALCLAAKSGVDVRIITPHNGDSKIVHFTTRSYYRQLIKSGVKVYEYKKGFIHSKLFVSDDTVATVGTVNLDFRSLYLNFECGTVMYGTDAVKDVKRDFEETFTECIKIDKKQCDKNIFVRICQSIMRVFAPLM